MADEVVSREEEYDLFFWGRVLRQRWRLLVFLSLATGMFTGGIAFVLVPATYTAEAVIDVPSQLPLLGLTGETIGMPSPSGAGMGISAVLRQSPLDRLIDVLRSSRIRLQVVERLDLQRRFEARTRTQAIRRLEGLTKIKQTRGGMIQIDTSYKAPPKFFLYTGLAPHPTLAQQMCSRIAQEYLQGLSSYLRQAERVGPSANREFLDTELAGSSKELGAAEERVRKFTEEHGVINIPGAEESIAGRLRSLQDLIATTEVDLQGTRHQLGEARSRLEKEGVKVFGQEETARNPLLDTLRQKLADLNLELERRIQFEKLTEGHPMVVELRQQIKGVEDELRKTLSQAQVPEREMLQRNPVYDTLRDRFVSALVSEAGLEARRSASFSMLQELESRGRTLPKIATEYRRLVRDLEIQDTIYKLLSQRLEEGKIVEELSGTRFVVLDEPTPPELPSGPSVSKTGLVGCLLGLMIGLGYYWMGAWKRLVTPAEPSREVTSGGA